MLAELYPRCHTRYASLPLLGPHLDGFVVWLRSQGYPRLPIRRRVRATKQLDALLRLDGVGRFEELSADEVFGRHRPARGMPGRGAVSGPSLRRLSQAASRFLRC